MIFLYGATALALIMSLIALFAMTIFEASFMGIKFTAIRLLVALPLVILTSMMLGKYLNKHPYEMMGKC